MRRDESDGRREPGLFELWMGMPPEEWDALGTASADEGESNGTDNI